jgi:two-component system response regulator MprA
VVVLDVMMPEVDGLTVCQRLRAIGDRTPVLLLTARDLVADRVQGLKAGADDYLTKPFAVDELLARVQALIRRSYPDHDAVLSVAGLSLNPRTRVVERGGRAIELTRTEFGLLEVLMLATPRWS